MSENPWEQINEGRNNFVEGFRGENPPIFASEAGKNYATGLMKNPNWRPTLEEPVPRVRCQYMKRDNTQCTRLAIPGAGLDPTDKVCCTYHGGTIPNVAAKAERVRTAAAEHLFEYVEDAISQIGTMITDTSVPDNVRLAASKDLLDRVGIKQAAEVNVTVSDKRSPVEILAEKIRNLNREPVNDEITEGTDADIVEEASD